ncbi:MAG: hypothetical protein NTY60_10420 [Proteobacteria bacterium]|nr:hypothetical protein [Pseudomonadota bacterium]
MGADAIKVSISPNLSGIPSSFDVSFTTAIEMLHILALGKWESTAPELGMTGVRNGISLKNSQQARLHYLLEGIGVINSEHTYSTLAVKTRNPKGNTDSKITKRKPEQGLALNGRWYLDCCLNLGQKLEVVDALSHLGYSRGFIKIAKFFVEGILLTKTPIKADTGAAFKNRNGHPF